MLTTTALCSFNFITGGCYFFRAAIMLREMKFMNLESWILLFSPKIGYYLICLFFLELIGFYFFSLKFNGGPFWRRGGCRCSFLPGCPGSLTADTELVNPGKLQGGMISVPDLLQILRGQQHRNPQLMFGRPVVLPLCLFVPGGFNTVIATLCPNPELITRLRKKKDMLMV